MVRSRRSTSAVQIGGKIAHCEVEVCGRSFPLTSHLSGDGVPSLVELADDAAMRITREACDAHRDVQTQMKALAHTA